MDLAKINLRQQLIDQSRHYFANHHFQEVITPCLSSHPPLESTIQPFPADQFFLSPSPENSLKKFISLGSGDCFSISHSFRSQESTSPIHSPEFLMLEWYQIGKNYADIIDTLQNLLLHIYLGLGKYPTIRVNNILEYQHQEINLAPPWVFLSLRQLFNQHAHQDLDKLLSDNSFNEPDFNQLFLNKIEPHLPRHKPLIVTDYPLKFSYFALPQQDNPAYAQRFEFYLAGIEIANGNTEDTQNPYHIPPCSGCGLGLDRLAMIFADSTNIQELSLPS